VPLMRRGMGGHELYGHLLARTFRWNEDCPVRRWLSKWVIVEGSAPELDSSRNIPHTPNQRPDAQHVKGSFGAAPSAQP
jgi:hypothetical protein